MSRKNARSIDIIIPYWGDVGLFREAVESVINQNSSDWHLIILDDHYSKLDAKKYIESLKRPQITYIRHPKNIGITSNFNFAIQTATADFCTIMGCDDRLLPNYVETALRNIGDADFYQPNVDVIDKSGNKYLPNVDKIKRWLRPQKPGIYEGQQLAASLCRGNWLYFPSIVWRVSTLKKYSFNPGYTITQDVILEMSMVTDGAKLALDNTVTFEYRRFDESLSSKEKKGDGKRFREESATYDMLANKFRQLGWTRASRIAKRRIISRIHQLVSKLT